MYTYKCELIRCVDGDTVDFFIDLGFSVKVKKRVRLFQIDAWESRTKDLEEKKKGLAAKKFLKNILRNANNLMLDTEKDFTGKYGRVLGTLFVDGTNINELLIEKGHAVRYVI